MRYRSRRCASVAVICGVAVGMLAEPVSASTAKLVDVVLPPECKYLPPGVPCLPGSAKVLVYQGEPGEANRVLLTGSRDDVRIDDPAAVIDAGEGCSAINAHSVRCMSADPGIFRMHVATASGADRVRSRLSGPVTIDGGPGDDVLTGGPSGDRLHGGRGADLLRGGDGADSLYDASRREPLRSGDPDPFSGETVIALADPGRGRDSFVGGRGKDTVSYEARAAGVTVTLANSAAVGGARREGDSVRSVENAVGGGGADRLAGTGRTNVLDGGRGADRIVARGGADFIEGGSGRNLIIAGPGDDQINAAYRPSDQGAERIFCGRGSDRVSWISPRDFVNDDCEEFELNFLREGGLFGGVVVSLLPVREGDPPSLLRTSELWCYSVANPSGCDLKLEVRVRGRGTLLGSESYTFAPDERRTVTFGLSPAGLTALRRRGTLVVRVSASEEAAKAPGGYQTILRSP